MPTVVHRPDVNAEASVFDSPIRAALKKVLRVTGLDRPEDQVLAVMNPLETGPVGGVVGPLLQQSRSESR